jgi:hypothetical protein
MSSTRTRVTTTIRQDSPVPRKRKKKSNAVVVAVIVLLALAVLFARLINTLVCRAHGRHPSLADAGDGGFLSFASHLGSEWNRNGSRKTLARIQEGGPGTSSDGLRKSMNLKSLFDSFSSVDPPPRSSTSAHLIMECRKLSSPYETSHQRAIRAFEGIGEESRHRVASHCQGHNKFRARPRRTRTPLTPLRWALVGRKLNLTLLPVLLPRFKPAMVTDAPIPPEPGETAVIVGMVPS